MAVIRKIDYPEIYPCLLQGSADAMRHARNIACFVDQYYIFGMNDRKTVFQFGSPEEARAYIRNNKNHYIDHPDQKSICRLHPLIDYTPFEVGPNHYLVDQPWYLLRAWINENLVGEVSVVLTVVGPKRICLANESDRFLFELTWGY